MGVLVYAESENNIIKKYKEFGLKAGFRFVESGPLVRSSYHAEKHLF